MVWDKVWFVFMFVVFCWYFEIVVFGVLIEVFVEFVIVEVISFWLIGDVGFFMEIVVDLEFLKFGCGLDWYLFYGVYLMVEGWSFGFGVWVGGKIVVFEIGDICEDFSYVWMLGEECYLVNG